MHVGFLPFGLAGVGEVPQGLDDPLHPSRAFDGFGDQADDILAQEFKINFPLCLLDLLPQLRRSDRFKGAIGFQELQQVIDVLLERSQIGVDEANGVVDFVGNACCQLADGGHLLRLQQLAAHLLELGVGGSEFGQALPQIAFAIPQLPPHAVQVHVGGHPCLDFLQMERLGDIVVAAGLEGPDLVGHVFQRTDENHRDIAQPQVGAQAPAGLEPIHAGHHHVEQDQVGRTAAGKLQAFGTAGGKADFVVVGQGGAEHFDVVRMVVDDQDTRLGGNFAVHDWGRSSRRTCSFAKATS